VISRSRGAEHIAATQGFAGRSAVEIEFIARSSFSFSSHLRRDAAGSSGSRFKALSSAATALFALPFRSSAEAVTIHVLVVVDHLEQIRLRLIVQSQLLAGLSERRSNGRPHERFIEKA